MTRSDSLLVSNDRGQVVGSSGSCADTHVAGFEIGPRSVLWNHGSPVYLGTLGGKTASAGAAVNTAAKSSVRLCWRMRNISLLFVDRGSGHGGIPA